MGAMLWLAFGCGLSEEEDERLAALLEIFSDLESTRLVGDEVLKAAPSWTTERALVRAMLSAPGWDGNTAPGSILADQIRLDFDNDRVLVVRGWWLSETEARLFALAALRAR